MSELHVGFSGTSAGCTLEQIASLSHVLESFEFTHFHHGVCIGADWQAHLIVQERLPLVRIEGHPPLNLKKTATDLTGFAVLHGPKDYLARDADIAKAAAILIATPETPHELRRSGTWTTVRYARRFKRLIIRVNPDGSTAIG